MNAKDQALAFLAHRDNEPLNWLFGDFLRAQAQAPGPTHFLLRLLADTRKDALGRLNWWIDECRKLVRNHDVLRQKVQSDLKPGKSDAEIKTKAVLAELFSVLHLAKIGYRNFEAVLPTHRASPDFFAELDGKRARIEVKSLNEPEDWITKAATDRWRERSHAEPHRYRLRAILNHNHRGSATDAAVIESRRLSTSFPISRAHSKRSSMEIFTSGSKNGS